MRTVVSDLTIYFIYLAIIMVIRYIVLRKFKLRCLKCNLNKTCPPLAMELEIQIPSG